MAEAKIVDVGHIDGLDGMRLSAMAQEVAPCEDSALDFLIGGDARVAELRAAIARAEADGDYEKGATLHQQMDALDGYDIERRAERMLLGLGFAPGDSARRVSDFSGGWRPPTTWTWMPPCGCSSGWGLTRAP